MSRENVEVIRELIDAWNDGDMHRVRDLYDPDAIARPPANVPEPGPYIGRDAIMREFNRIREAFDGDAFEVLGDPVATADRVLVRTLWKGAGRGPEVDVEMTLLYTVRRERVFELEYFWNYDEALEAVGLRE